MIERVLTGGQQGSDLGAWKAAKAAGIPCSGWMPKGFRTENPRHPRESESHPEYADLFGAREHPSFSYPPRTEANVKECDCVLIFGNIHSAGSRATLAACQRNRKPWFWAQPGITRPSDVVRWLRSDRSFKVLLIAGNRESSSPGIEGRVALFLTRVFARLKQKDRE